MSQNEAGRRQELLQRVAEESAALTHLYRLSRLQQRVMIRRDTRRLAWVSAEIERALPETQSLSRRREQVLLAMAPARARRGRGLSLQVLLEDADSEWRTQLGTALQELAQAGEKLQRRNFQNHQLAAFSLDLVREEMRILVGADGEGGAYAADGRRANRDLSGMLDGRA